MTEFLVDQQLPRALPVHLSKLGHDARRIKDYPGGETLPDNEVTRIADVERRVVITNDDDVRISHLLHRRPARLVHLTCGNISTGDLLALFDQHRPGLVAALADFRYLELGRPGVIIHDPS